MIPCVDSLEGRAWRYEFERASDPNSGDLISFDLSCPSLSFDFFIQEVNIANILTLSLNPTPLFMPTVGEHECTLKLSDLSGLDNTYSVNF